MPLPASQPFISGRKSRQAHSDTRAAASRAVIRNDRAFTLIEMIVVTALISLVLVVAVPRLSGGLFSDGSNETARWIITTVRQLKERAVLDQQTYLLHVSPDLQRIWITDALMTEEDMDAARDSGFALPVGVRIDHVAFSPTERFSSGTVSIGFYPKGYSDRAVIRLRTHSGDRLAFFIEPFLHRVELARGGQGW